MQSLSKVKLKFTIEFLDKNMVNLSLSPRFFHERDPCIAWHKFTASDLLSLALHSSEVKVYFATWKRLGGMVFWFSGKETLEETGKKCVGVRFSV